LQFAFLLNSWLILRFGASSPSFSRFAAAAEIGQDHHDQMRGEPDVFVAHILVDIDQDQNARRENAEQNVGLLRHGIFGIPALKKINEQNDAREEKRKKQKIKIHKTLRSKFFPRL
jgi:hypothetical protein